jgi:hypothetical protein
VKSRILHGIALLTLSIGGWQGNSPIEAQSDDDERARAATTLENGKREAKEYVVRSGSDNEPITLQPESFLRWQNNVNKSVHGNIFLWTRNGRPELVSSIFQYYSPRQAFAAEFHSLSLGPLNVEKEGMAVWTPKAPGIVLKPFDESIEPAQTKPQRLQQMRKLAQSFTVDLTEYDGIPYQMRLMNQPLYRYESTDPELLDGALFAYTYTTDPDLIVVIEARKSGDRFQWQYGLARMNTGSVKVTCNNREVFQAERLETFFHKDGPYTIFSGLPVPSR